MMAEVEEPPVIIRPQPGPQEAFLSSEADIVFYGGAAGAGKTFAVLLEGARHAATVKDFAAVVFRRTTPQIKNPGGLWDESMKLYPLIGGQPTAHGVKWSWEGAGKVEFSHLEHEKDKFNWQGSQIPLIIFDEVTHFSETQFFYMVSRNRSMCGVRPYIRGTCNPDADSWVARLIAWWIDKDTGFPIPERSGVVRYFIRVNDAIIWGESKEELILKYGLPGLPHDDPLQVQPKSFTFIPGKLSDNQALMKQDPGYLANLKALPVVEQARLLGGNWKIRAAAGLLFKRAWVKVVDTVPNDLDIMRYWDLAATEKTDTNDPDWTVGFKLGRDRTTGRLYALHCVYDQVSPFNVEQMILNTASSDGAGVRIGLPQDPAQAGKAQAMSFIRMLAMYNVRARREQGDKVLRFGPFSAQCEAGNVYFLRGHWNEFVFEKLENFPDGKKDVADACSGAYTMLLEGESGLLDYYREEAEKRKQEQAKIEDKHIPTPPQTSGLLQMMKQGQTLT